MDIIQALQQSKEKEPIAIESHDYMKEEVFECHLYRLGYDSRYYKDVLPSDREEFLTRLERQK